MTLTFTLYGAPTLPNRARGSWVDQYHETNVWRRDAYVLLFERMLLGGWRWSGETPVTVTFTRVHTRGAGPDSDNLISSLKAVRDGIADCLFHECKVHDQPCGHLHDWASSLVKWRYAKRSGAALAVEIEVST